MGVSRIFWDSNLFVYLFEDNVNFSPATKKLRQSMLERGDQLLTSTLSLGEILVKPLEKGQADRCQQYEDALSRSAILVPFDQKAARRYAAIRSNRIAKGPDAVQLACAAEAGVDLFITNDQRLRGRQVEGIQFIVALEQVPI
jgi:predicted nucleic acid-binding protein